MEYSLVQNKFEELDVGVGFETMDLLAMANSLS